MLSKISELKSADYNPRTISYEALKGLSYSIEEFGDLSGIVFNKQTGNLVAGHQRVKAITEKYGDLPIFDEKIVTDDGNEFNVRIVDWDIQKEKAANIAANNPHIQGEFTPGLQLILNEIKLNVPDYREKLNLSPLEILPIQHELTPESISDKELTKADLNITIGEYVFKLTREEYLKWIEEIKINFGFSENAIVKEFKKRLGIEN